MALVSVVMPTHNYAHYLGEAIDSLRSQTFSDWELVVVDDASDDDTGQVLDAYCDDRRIRVVRNDFRRGEARSRNRGIGLASGKYCAVADADDWLGRRRLEISVAAMEQGGYDGIGGGISYADWRGRPLLGGWIQLPMAPEQVRRAMALYCAMAHTTVMVRTDRFREFGLYDESFDIATDWATWQRWAWEGATAGFRVLPARLGRVRRHSYQMTAARGSEELVAARHRLLHRGMEYLGIALDDDALRSLANPWRLPVASAAADLEVKLAALRQISERSDLRRVAALLSGYYLYYAPVGRVAKLRAMEKFMRGPLGCYFPVMTIGCAYARRWTAVRAGQFRGSLADRWRRRSGVGPSGGGSPEHTGQRQ